MFPLSRILWPCDGSDNAYSALEAAAGIAEHYGAKIFALQVVQKVPDLVTAGYTTGVIHGFDTTKYEGELVKSVEENLRNAVVTRVRKSVEVETRVEIGEPAEVIKLYAKEHQVDLIVMTTHRGKDLAHWMMGSVAEKTIRQSDVPILIIPADSEE